MAAVGRAPRAEREKLPPEQAAIFKAAGLRIKTIAQECVPSLRKMPDQNKFEVIPQRGAFQQCQQKIAERRGALIFLFSRHLKNIN